MRIIGGSAAGTILKVPKGFDVRPTPDLVRQAVFNSLGPRVAGARGAGSFCRHGRVEFGMPQPRRGAAPFASRNPAATPSSSGRTSPWPACPTPRWKFACRTPSPPLAQLAAAGCQFDLLLADPPYGEKNISRRSTSLAQQLLDDPSPPKLAPARRALHPGPHQTRHAGPAALLA